MSKLILIADEKAKKLKPDLILLGLAMPRMNGVEVAAVLKRIMPQVRIVLYTMHGGKDRSLVIPTSDDCYKQLTQVSIDEYGPVRVKVFFSSQPANPVRRQHSSTPARVVERFRGPLPGGRLRTIRSF